MRASRFAAMLLVALLGAVAHAAELGTLLTTPEERERLERLRRGEPEPTAGEPARARGQVTGFVKRSDGRNTLWVDGIPVRVTTPRAGPLLEPSAVGAYAERKDERLHVERRTPR